MVVEEWQSFIPIPTVLSMDRLTFSNNSAVYGGGIEVYYSNCTFNGQVTFSNNSADHMVMVEEWKWRHGCLNSNCTFNGQVDIL